MSKTDLEAWLEEVEDIVTDKPKYWAINQGDLADMAHDLLKLVKKQREALIEIAKPTKLGEHEDPWHYRQSIAREALEYDPRGEE